MSTPMAKPPAIRALGEIVVGPQYICSGTKCSAGESPLAARGRIGPSAVLRENQRVGAGRTMTTGQGLCAIKARDVEPSNMPVIALCPRLPATISCADGAYSSSPTPGDSWMTACSTWTSGYLVVHRANSSLSRVRSTSWIRCGSTTSDAYKGKGPSMPGSVQQCRATSLAFRAAAASKANPIAASLVGEPSTPTTTGPVLGGLAEWITATGTGAVLAISAATDPKETADRFVPWLPTTVSEAVAE